MDELKLGSKLTLSQLQIKAYAWTRRNFPGGKPYQPLLGLIEELGELAHAHLKRDQGIRTNEDHQAKEIDAVGDIFIYLMDYCNRNDLDLTYCILKTWAEVSQRNWLDHKENGFAPNNGG